MYKSLNCQRQTPLDWGHKCISAKQGDHSAQYKLFWPSVAIRGMGCSFITRIAPPITKSRFVDDFRRMLTNAGFHSRDYSGQSFCIGAASTAAANGIEDFLIQTLGRWKSSAYLAYIKLHPSVLAAVSTRLASCPTP